MSNSGDANTDMEIDKDGDDDDDDEEEQSIQNFINESFLEERNLDPVNYPASGLKKFFDKEDYKIFHLWDFFVRLLKYNKENASLTPYCSIIEKWIKEASKNSENNKNIISTKKRSSIDDSYKEENPSKNPINYNDNGPKHYLDNYSADDEDETKRLKTGTCLKCRGVIFMF